MTEWYKEPLNFLGINVLILAFFLTLVIFLNQYLQLGSVLIEGISGAKFIIILPVVIVLALTFFMFTYIIIAGIIVALLLSVFYGISFWINYFLDSQQQNKIEEILNIIFFKSFFILVLVIPVLSLLFVKKGLFTFSQFMLIYYLVYLFLAFYLFGLLNLAAGRLYASTKKKIFLVNSVPILIIIIFGLVFAAWILPKTAAYIT